MTLPVYELVISNDETSDVEVSFVALVDKPAIEKNFMRFSDQSFRFAINEEKKIISGPAMIAGQLIYRKDETGEYNVFFSPETVREIAVKFFKKDYQKNLNLFHDPSLSVEGVTIFESFVSDVSRGIQPMKGFEDLPDGTWFISAKVDNEDVWNKIKSGEVKGFSVEGIFSYMKPVNGTTKANSHLNTYQEINFMSEIKDLWAKFKEKFLGEVTATPAPEVPAAPVQLSEMKLKDGTVIIVDKLEAGGLVVIGEAPAPPGDYELEDGTKLTVGEGGVITAIEAVEAPEAPEQVMQNDYSETFAGIEQKFADYEQKFSAYEARIKTAEDAYAKQSEQMTSLIELVGKLIETPTAETVVGGKNNFSTQKAETKAERISGLAELLKKIKTK